LLKQVYADGDYREFGVTDGLPSMEGVKRSPSVELDNRGNIWFSLKQGISFLPPSAFADPAFPVTMRIEGMLVDGKYVATGDHIRVSSGRHRLTFQYAGINVSNREAVRYHYRLADVDSSWSEPTSLREVDFTNVAPGRFEFQVAARNSDGVWNSKASAIAFEVEPSILQTRWFQVTSVGVLALLALGVYQLRVQQLHRQFNIGMEARVNERTRIARDLHDTLRSLINAEEAATELVDLNEVAREVVALSLTDIERCQVIWELELADRLPLVPADPIQLQQVILNLLRNAVDAMSEIEGRTKRLIVRTERTQRDSVCLSVEDVGVGIDPHKTERLFAPFFTTKTTGMGIGLSVSRAIIESHHGRLWAAPNDGPGTTFSFSIPCKPDNAVEDWRLR
jgi:signal transduction histidine kinase